MKLFQNARKWRSRTRPAVICILAALVTICGYFTHFRGYDKPSAFFWDENYHIAHAQKYLNGVFFMEPHPPLGKLLIALGEKLIAPNRETNHFITVDNAKNPPAGFSFAGFRLFPALLSWLTAPLIFFLFLNLTGRPLWAAFLSSLYLFDNALIVHGRGAMLESPQLFFIVGMLLAVLALYKRSRSSAAALAGWGVLAGVCFAAAVTTKVNALILALLFPLIIWRYRGSMKRLALIVVALGVSFFAVYYAVWQTHFNLGRTIVAKLPQSGWYQASQEYKEILGDGRVSQVSSFPIMLRDSFRFVGHYQRGVPKLNLCSSNDNGSPPLFWPFGARTINYRWEREGDLTKYLYLVPNPFTWFISLIAVLGALGLVLSRALLPFRYPLRQPNLLLAFLGMYVSYMLVMSALPRVMYLYHYFLPLIFGFVLCAILLREVRNFGRHRIIILNGVLAVAALLSFLTYRHFSPFTYAMPISDSAVKSRAWINLWDLRPAEATLVNGIAEPLCDPRVKNFPNVTISGVRAVKGYQDWGDPTQNYTVENRPLTVQGVTYADGFGVHAASQLEFPLEGRFTRFSGKVGLPDYLATKPDAKASVRFEILGDGRLLWSSSELRAGGVSEPFTVDVSNVKALTLAVKDGGDGIDSDHAVWLDPQLE